MRGAPLFTYMVSSCLPLCFVWQQPLLHLPSDSGDILGNKHKLNEERQTLVMISCTDLGRQSSLDKKTLMMDHTGADEQSCELLDFFCNPDPRHTSLDYHTSHPLFYHLHHLSHLQLSIII